MAVITPATVSSGGYKPVTTTYGTSGSNTDGTLSTAAITTPSELIAVLVNYSGAATQAGVTTVLNSGLGSGYDATLNTGSADAQLTTYLPSVPIPLQVGDAIDVTALAGGAVTAAIQIITRAL